MFQFEAEPDLLQYFYDAGMGSRHSAGFGLLGINCPGFVLLKGGGSNVIEEFIIDEKPTLNCQLPSGVIRCGFGIDEVFLTFWQSPALKEVDLSMS